MMYQRLTEGLKSVGKLIPENANLADFIKNDKDYYLSVYKYNEAQKADAEQTVNIEEVDQLTGEVTTFTRPKGIKGIEDVVTNIIAFDFDGTDLEKARKDTVITVERLLDSEIEPHAINVSFSGGKGFSVVVQHDSNLTPEQHKTIAQGIAGDLETFDSTVYNASRIFRVDGTKHNKTGLYKTQLELDTLIDPEMTIEKIKSLAKTKHPVKSFPVIKLPQEILKLKPKEKEVAATPNETKHILDFSKKPYYLTDLKYALHKGFIPPHRSNEGFMILCSTYKHVGFDKTDAYHMLKAVNERRAEIYEIPKKDKNDIWKEIIEVIYDDSWKGGTYSVENSALLQETAKKFGVTEALQNTPKFMVETNSKFKNYVMNIDKNTVKTGIHQLDRKLFLSTGANIALLGAPGSGKSSLALEILRNTSIAGVKSVFASFDMSATRMHEKILYKLTGLDRDALYQLYKDNKDQELIDSVKKNFGNVYMYDKSMSSVDDLRTYILKCQEHSGEKIKLVVIDYFERIFSDIPDDTASSKKVAGQLQNLVNDLDICLITLVQPNKMSGDMASPITSYSNIKGSSFLAQSFRIIMGIYREGFSPLDNSQDKFLTINILKNDLGENFSLDFKWNGKKGEINQLTGSELNELKNLREELKGSKEDDNW